MSAEQKAEGGERLESFIAQVTGTQFEEADAEALRMLVTAAREETMGEGGEHIETGYGTRREMQLEIERLREEGGKGEALWREQYRATFQRALRAEGEAAGYRARCYELEDDLQAARDASPAPDREAE